MLARLRATTISPVVSLSSRCTMPARGRFAACGSRASSPLRSVPLQFPGAGCTTSPAGLFSTSRCASSYRTSRAMACGRNAWLCGVGCSSMASRSPDLTFAAGRRTGSPFNRTSPDSIRCCRWLRENSGAMAARARSIRAPWKASATMPSRTSLSAPGSSASSTDSVRGSVDIMLGLCFKKVFRDASHQIIGCSVAGDDRHAGAAPGCASTTADPTVGWSPNKIYAEAKDEAASGAYDKAIPLYEKLEGRAAGTPLAQQAQIEKAYAQFKNGEQAQAISTLDRFMKLHPASPAIDYALYLKGLINFNDNLGLFASDRQAGSVRARSESCQGILRGIPRGHHAVPGIEIHARCPPADDLHRQLAGPVRSARGALLLHARRLCRGHQPRPDRRQSITAKYRPRKKPCSS